MRAFSQTYENVIINTDTTVYLGVCEQGSPPSFPGGDKKMAFYVKKYMCPAYKANKLKGSVSYSFIVEKDGMLSKIKVDEQGLPSIVTNEVKCALYCMPIWKPAISCIDKDKTKGLGYYRHIYYGSIDQEKCIYFPHENLKN
ncbi:hypothetical protein [Emticicia oligotrophica]|uniref:hypothetical protein n=1 Tax=Emticicia oligotrophica TaxID=312279 RepID=UPI00273B5FDC|nr:hypothetical protein [Emticicia oligotrophica]